MAELIGQGPPDQGPGGGPIEAKEPTRRLPEEIPYSSYGINPELLTSPDIGVVRWGIGEWMMDQFPGDRMPPTPIKDPYTLPIIVNTLLQRRQNHDYPDNVRAFLSKRYRDRNGLEEAATLQKESVDKETLRTLRNECFAFSDVWNAIGYYQSWRGDQEQMAMNMFLANEVALLTMSHWGGVLNIKGSNIDYALRIYMANGAREFPVAAAMKNPELERLMKEATQLDPVANSRVVEHNISRVDELARQASELDGGTAHLAPLSATMAYWLHQIWGEAAWYDKSLKGLPVTDDRVKFFHLFDRLRGESASGHPRGADETVALLSEIRRDFGGLDFCSVSFLRWLTYIPGQEEYAAAPNKESVPQEKRPKKEDMRTFHEAMWYEGKRLDQLFNMRSLDQNAWRDYLLRVFFAGRKDKGVFGRLTQPAYPIEELTNIQRWSDWFKAVHISTGFQNVVAAPEYDSSVQLYRKLHGGRKFVFDRDLEDPNLKLETPTSKLQGRLTDVFFQTAVGWNKRAPYEKTWEKNYLIGTDVVNAMEQARDRAKAYNGPPLTTWQAKTFPVKELNEMWKNGNLTALQI